MFTYSLTAKVPVIDLLNCFNVLKEADVLNYFAFTDDVVITGRGSKYDLLKKQGGEVILVVTFTSPHSIDGSALPGFVSKLPVSSYKFTRIG